MADRFGNPFREDPLRGKRQLPRLDLTGQNVGAPRRSPTKPRAPGRDTAPVSPTAAPAVDPRIAQTRNAVGGALNQALEFGDAALGDVAALGARANAALTGGLGRLTGLVAPQAGGEILAAADAQRSFADNVARRGLFTEGTFDGDFSAQNPPATPQTPLRGQARAQGTPAAQPQAAQAPGASQGAQQDQPAGREAIAAALGQQLPNLASLPLDTGTSEDSAPRKGRDFVVVRRGTEESIVPIGPDGRTLPQTFEFGGQTFTPAQAEKLAPIIGQQINAQGNAEAARIRAGTKEPVEVSERAGAQIFNTALAAFQRVAQDSKSTPEEVANAETVLQETLRFLVQGGRSDAEALAALAQVLGG